MAWATVGLLGLLLIADLPERPALPPRVGDLTRLIAEASDAHDAALDELLARGPSPVTLVTLARLAEAYDRADLVPRLSPFVVHRSPAVRGAVFHLWAQLDPIARPTALLRCLNDPDAMARRPCYAVVAEAPATRYQSRLWAALEQGDDLAIPPFVAVADPAVLEQIILSPPAISQEPRALLYWALLRRPELGDETQRAWLEVALADALGMLPPSEPTTPSNPPEDPGPPLIPTPPASETSPHEESP